MLIAGLALAGAQRAAAESPRFEDFRYAGRSIEGVKAGPGEYLNPILAGYHPDPSLVRVGDDYLLINSSFSHFPGIPIFRSKDLVHWTQIGNAIDRPTQLDFSNRKVSEGVFAPDISFHDGTYYIVNTCVGCGGNFVITARDPAGPWSDPVWLDFGGIDPSITWEGDRAYIVHNDAPAEPPRYDGHRAIWLQEFDWKARKMVGPRRQIVNGGTSLADKPIWIEGPHIFRHDDHYYLIAAQGGTGDAHSEVVFRSAKIDGPYEPYAANPILTQRNLPADRAHPVTSAGHAMMVKTQKGDWWASFLATRPYRGGEYNIGRETFLLPVTWKNGWPEILPAGQVIPYAAKAPDLPASAAPLPTSGDYGYRETFDRKTLPVEWIGIRTPKAPFYRLEKGALVLTSGAALGDVSGVPSFIGRRQEHAIADVSTTLRFRPSKDGDQAGLVAIQNDQSLLFFGISREGGQDEILLSVRDKADADTIVARAPVHTDKPIGLAIHINGGTISFDYDVDGQAHSLKSGVDAGFLSTQRAGGFVGTVIGPFYHSK
ncbi:glycoside hydrolase family 43 protein [Sphingomonas sp.]|uniref:glycoside hydrolase family 43 protein n=1 Tax=Sphingomonas sp. TaxID=28214 RepID=UPI000DB3CE2F|nr:glycoside hydrolase family 43 protein [Sphingomonas sp.]PZU08855.1 MAG: glycoside hydrolase 43 family protein [Sphingomonas sp.]